VSAPRRGWLRSWHDEADNRGTHRLVVARSFQAAAACLPANGTRLPLESNPIVVELLYGQLGDVASDFPPTHDDRVLSADGDGGNCR